MTFVADLQKVIDSLDSLSSKQQTQLAEQIRIWLLEFGNDDRWDALFASSQDALERSAEKALEDIAAGKSKPMDFEQL